MIDRTRHWLLLSLFLGVVFAVPVAQALIDKLVEEEPKPLVATLFDRAPTEQHLRDFEKLLEESSYFEQRIRPLFQLGRYRALRDMGEKALRGQAPGWYFYTPGLRYLVEPYFRDLRQPPADDPVATIADFARQLQARGIELLVVPIPGKASVYPDRLLTGIPGPSARLSPHTPRFVGELQRAGLLTLDLHQVFWSRRRQQPGEQLYMKADTHWTGHGVLLAARAIARWVEARPWFAALPRPATPRYRRDRVWVSRAGDIPEMTRIPQRERLFGGEKVVAFRVFASAGGAPYEDPEDPEQAPILVLGDSFSRVFQTDAPEAAGLIANLACELQLPLGSIVNDGGASTLVRQALARDLDQLRGKKLVVWAFVERDIRFGRGGWQKFDLFAAR